MFDSTTKVRHLAELFAEGRGNARIIRHHTGVPFPAPQQVHWLILVQRQSFILKKLHKGCSFPYTMLCFVLVSIS